jgi:hypothetical protein
MEPIEYLLGAISGLTEFTDEFVEFGRQHRF